MQPQFTADRETMRNPPQKNIDPAKQSVSVQIQKCLSRLAAGDEAAREQAIEVAFERLFFLARKIKKDFPTVARTGMETGDVLHDAYFRLDRALRDVHPSSVREFYGFAALQIRRVLLDVCRHLKGRAQQGGGLTDLSGDQTWSPDGLTDWSEFHEFVQSLEPELKEIVDLLFYQGLSQREAAEVLGVNERTVKRRWRNAREQIGPRFGALAEDV